MKTDIEIDSFIECWFPPVPVKPVIVNMEYSYLRKKFKPEADFSKFNKIKFTIYDIYICGEYVGSTEAITTPSNVYLKMPPLK